MRGLSWVPALLLLAAGCIESRQWVPEIEPPLAARASRGEAGPAQATVGLRLEEELAGGLEAMDFLGGLRVVRVADGSPAQAAGILEGDLVLGAGGMDLRTLDQWEAVLDAREPGDVLSLRVERQGGVVDVSLPVVQGGPGRLPAPTAFTERWKARVIVQTVAMSGKGREAGEGGVAEGGDGRNGGARIVRLLPFSPLGPAGLGAGDILLRLDGERIAGASDLVRRLAAREFGSKVVLGYVPGGAGGPGPSSREGAASGERAASREGASSREVSVTLWSPRRHLTRLSLLPLFDWREEPDASSMRFSLVDLWLISLFDYRREGRTSRYRVLRFLTWETGSGELEELEHGPAGGSP